VECETYVLPIVFVLLCCHRLLLIQADFSKPVNHLLLGLFNALAVVFHQQHVLMGVVILVAYVLMMLTPRPAIAWKTWLSRCFLYACSCAVVVLGSYLVVAVLVKDLSGPSEIATWMM
jgi:hypothetical protein